MGQVRVEREGAFSSFVSGLDGASGSWEGLAREGERDRNRFRVEEDSSDERLDAENRSVWDESVRSITEPWPNEGLRLGVCPAKVEEVNGPWAIRSSLGWMKADTAA